MKKLSEYSINDNNFNLLRVIFASLVIYSHSYVLSLGVGYGKDPIEQMIGLSLGALSVNAFFVVSGFLVTKSLLIRKNLFKYFLARFFRIYPGLFFAVLFSVFIVGVIFTRSSLFYYFTHKGATLHYIWHNITLTGDLKFGLPGVFLKNPLPRSLIIPIWTLPWEIKMYISLALFGVLGIMKKPFFMLVMTVIFTVVFFANDAFSLFHGRYIHDLLQFLTFFYLGSCFYLFRDNIILGTRFFLLSIILVVFSFKFFWFKYLFYLFSVYWVFFLAYVPSGKIIRGYNKFGDYSYGLYIYGFMIQQSIVAIYTGVTPIKLFVLAFGVTLIIAVLSWHNIESRFLRLKNISIPSKISVKLNNLRVFKLFEAQ
ncbi:MAG: acyltransferase [Gammaproteobacteria bacterium]|nr:acyltransferase [Gammaproteobacteria bacterium]